MKFCLSGGLTAGFSYAVCVSLAKVGLGTREAGAAAYLVSVPMGFALHKVFSFESKNEVSRDGWRFALVSVASALLAGLTLEQATTKLGLTMLPALAVVAAVVTPVNFLAMRGWVFMKVRTKQTS